MKSIMQVAPLLWFIVIAGCSDDSKPAKMEDTVLKTQTDALNKAKQVDQTLMDSAAKQRQNIEKETQ
jgi:hypothetical protein